MTWTEPGVDAKTRRDVDLAAQRLAEIIGVDRVEIRSRRSGLEPWWDVVVGRRAPVYEHALSQLYFELPDTSELYGRMGIDASDRRRGAEALEARALQAAIHRSLNVTREMLLAPPTSALHVPFASGEDTAILEPVNHAVWGRRGVGKSSLVLQACRRLRQRQNPYAWVDGQLYVGRDDPLTVVQIVEDALLGLVETAEEAELPGADALATGLEAVRSAAETIDTPDDLHPLVRPVNQALHAFFAASKKHCYIFVDDVHLVPHDLQALLVGILLRITSGAGGVTDIVGVRSLVDLALGAGAFRVQIPDDLQVISLDRTLEDPSGTHEHLESVLLAFMKHCGYRTIGQLVSPQAVERLVWCSGGVPRDFLWLLEKAIGYARQRTRDKIGVEMVNRATGELHEEKMRRLSEEAPEEAGVLQVALERLAHQLRQGKNSAFLVPSPPRTPEHTIVQKLADLRLIHLIHPGITPSTVGDRHQAYILDYSFYTGVRRMRDLNVLKTQRGQSPTYEVLRKLPKIDPATLVANEES